MRNLPLIGLLSVMDAGIGGFLPRPVDMLISKLRTSITEGRILNSSSFYTRHQVASVSSSRYAVRQGVDCCSLHQSTMIYAGCQNGAANSSTVAAAGSPTYPPTNDSFLQCDEEGCDRTGTFVSVRPRDWTTVGRVLCRRHRKEWLGVSS